MSEYAVIARFRQPGEPPFGKAIIELRQYDYDVARYVNGELQGWTFGCTIDNWDIPGFWPAPHLLLEEWIAFERKIGSEMEQWVKLT